MWPLTKCSCVMRICSYVGPHRKMARWTPQFPTRHSCGEQGSEAKSQCGQRIWKSTNIVSACNIYLRRPHLCLLRPPSAAAAVVRAVTAEPSPIAEPIEPAASAQPPGSFSPSASLQQHSHQQTVRLHQQPWLRNHPGSAASAAMSVCNPPRQLLGD